MKQFCSKLFSRRATAVTLAALMTVGSTVFAAGAESGPELPVSYDEAYYATLDYYGGLTEGSMVKSYRLRGGDHIVDYGTYDKVNNLTDRTEPSTTSGKVEFAFGEEAPDTFYFEGKTAKPYEKLPWDISLSYRMNGVPVKAEEMAGQKGVAQITLDLIPNAGASEYAQHNFVLMASTAFNDDDILSLSAPGAQVQLVGNLRTVIFMALPGEEQHFTMEVGSEDFSFSGMILMMMPATLAQLEQVADLREAKADIEDSYDKLSESLDTILDSLDGMGGELRSVADGLEDLEKARHIISQSTQGLYSDFDLVLKDMGDLKKGVGSLHSDLNDADHAVTDINNSLTELYGGISDLRKDLESCVDTLNAIAESMEGEAEEDPALLEELAQNLENLRKDTASLQEIANQVSTGTVTLQPEGMTAEEVQQTLQNTQQIYEAYLASGGEEEDMEAFATFLVAALEQQGYPAETAQETAANMLALYEANVAITDINKQGSQLVDLAGVSGLTEDMDNALGMAEDVSGLCGTLEKLLATLETEGADPSAASKALASTNALLGQMQKLIYTMGSYQDEVHDAIDDGQSVGKQVREMLSSLRVFLTNTEGVIKESEPYLSRGTKKTLNNLAAALRQSASGLDQTGAVRDAKNTVTDLIDEKWDEHTGDVDNLLLVDPDAACVSLTDTRNDSPESIQVIMRTQEIKTAEDENAPSKAAAEDQSTLGSRIMDMFRDLWSMITGLFRRGE
ncbi:MAG: hypothetical protein PHD67_06800 [Oscillospiraceae bacterium]|nr:hypothetical protein [Oscillospiraceae bacterium]